MINPEDISSDEEVYQLTPKGKMVVDFAGTINNMLAEQRKSLGDTLFLAEYLVRSGKHWEAASQLADAMCILGYNPTSSVEG